MVLSNGCHLSEKTISAKHGTTAAGLSPNTMIPSLHTWAPTDQTPIIPNYGPQQWYQLPLQAIQNNRKRRMGEREGPGVGTCIRSGGQSKKPRHSEIQKMIVMEVFKQRKRHRRQKSREYKKRINQLERKTHKNEERLEKQEERIGEVYNWVVPRVGSSTEKILDWATLQGLLYKPDGESHEESHEESDKESSEESSEESDDQG